MVEWDVLYDARAIEEAVARIARGIERDLMGAEVLVVPILNASLFFASDLLRALSAGTRSARPAGRGASVDIGGFSSAVVSSYGASAGDGRGRVAAPRVTVFPAKALVAGRHVLVVDTVVDTGATAKAVLDRARRAGARSARLACLVDKPAHRRADVRPDWAGFSAPDRFLVGYGLDAGGRWRTLPFVAALCGPAGEASTP